MSKGYRSDTNANAYPQLGPIRFGGICLTDIMQNGSRRIPGAQDEVFGQAPYGIIKLYLTVRSWMAALSHLLDCYLLFFILFRSGPGYRGDLISVDLYAAGMRPTRGSIAIEAAKMFCRYIEVRSPASAFWFVL